MNHEKDRKNKNQFDRKNEKTITVKNQSGEMKFFWS